MYLILSTVSNLDMKIYCEFLRLDFCALKISSRKGTYIKFGFGTVSLCNACDVALAIPLAIGLEAKDTCLESHLGVFCDFGLIRVSEDAVD